MSKKASTPRRFDSEGSRVGGAITRTRAPMVFSRWMFERATRLWLMSPQMATRRPSSRPRRRRMVSASSSAWVGCSWLPSPALMTAPLTFSDSSLTAPESGMAHDQHVRVHGVQGHGGVEQGFALLDRGPGDRHVDHVGPQALGRQLERRAGAGRALEEQVDDRQAGQNVAPAAGPAVELHVTVGQVQQISDLGSRQPLDAEEGGDGRSLEW